jgi:hypothetical protein
VVLASRLLLPNLDLLEQGADRPAGSGTVIHPDQEGRIELTPCQVDDKFEYLSGHEGSRETTYRGDGSIHVSLIDDQGNRMGAFVARHNADRSGFTMTAADCHGNEDTCQVSYSRNADATLTMVIKWESGDLFGWSSTSGADAAGADDIIWDVRIIGAEGVVDAGRITIDHETGDALWSEDGEDGDD